VHGAVNFFTNCILPLTHLRRERIMRPVTNFQVISMTAAFKQASTRKRHDAIVVMPACLWAAREVFGST
jgi:hypothetical protein